MKNYLKITLILLLLLSVNSIYGQAPPPPDSGGGGDGTVTDVLPINFLVYPFLVIGAHLGYVFIKKSSK